MTEYLDGGPEMTPAQQAFFNATKHLEEETATLSFSLALAKESLLQAGLDYHPMFFNVLFDAISEVEAAQVELMNTFKTYPALTQSVKLENTMYHPASDTIKLVKSEIDRLELQKNARVLGEAGRAFHDEDRSPISELPKEIFAHIVKFSMFTGDVAEEKEVNQIFGKAFSKPN